MYFEIIPVIAILGSFALTGFVVWAITRSRQRRHELQAEVQSRLIERFNSAPELAQFLESPAGRQFVNGVQSGPRFVARNKIVTGMSRAIILSMIGVAFILMGFAIHEDGLAVPGIGALCLGVGYGIATMVSMKLSQKLGIVEPMHGGAPQTHTPASTPSVPAVRPEDEAPLA